MNLTGKLYGVRPNGGSHGDVFTSPDAVRFMLDLMGYTSDKDLSKVSILEPSCGEGDFLIEIQRRIIASSVVYCFDSTDVMSSNVYACELDDCKLNRCVQRLQAQMSDFDPIHFKNEDFLLSDWEAHFDFIVGNPPYVRYENIPADVRERYKSLFSSFHYRCDLYVLFYERALTLLKSNGVHCFVCPNRWLKNEYGKKLRRMISDSFNLKYIINIENLKVFGEEVLAYPTITLISNEPNQFNIRTAQIDKVEELTLGFHYVEKSYDSTCDWESVFLDENMTAFPTIQQQGFTIGIGVATGADDVFISPSLSDDVEREVLLPLINARDVRGDKLGWAGRYLLNPYDQNGTLIDLDAYPRTKKYLERYREKLEKRHIVKNNKVWYSLIDKIKPALLRQPKILLPEMSANNIIFVDKGKFYPAHNMYYITGGSEERLELLAAVLMSSFVKEQMERLSNRMNGGFLRWQSQSIKKLRLPLLMDISPSNSRKLLAAYHRREMREIDQIVTEIVKEFQNNRTKSKATHWRQLPFSFDKA